MLQVVENVGDTVVELKGRRREVAGRLIRRAAAEASPGGGCRLCWVIAAPSP